MAGITPHRILVPVSGAATDYEAVRLGCRLAKRDRAEVEVITVIELPRGLALGTVQSADLEVAEGLLSKAEAAGKELDITVQTDLLQAREAGPAIVHEAAERGSDLIVVGLPYRERFGEFYLGKTAPYVLTHAAARVMLFREPHEA